MYLCIFKDPWFFIFFIFFIFLILFLDLVDDTIEPVEGNPRRDLWKLVSWDMARDKVGLLLVQPLKFKFHNNQADPLPCFMWEAQGGMKGSCINDLCRHDMDDIN